MAYSKYREATAQAIRGCVDKLGGVHVPVVDIGGGGWKDWIEKVIDNPVETWDISPGPEVARMVNICATPPVLNYAGTVICSSVLEHIETPYTAADNIAKILKPGGAVIVTAPFLYSYHEAPRDYWRFTPDGLALLFSELEILFKGWYYAEMISTTDTDIGSCLLGIKRYSGN